MAGITAPPLTIEEFSRLPGDCERHEMSAGELITVQPLRFIHKRVARRVFKAIEAFLDRAPIGEAYAEAVQRAPELVIEIVSLSDSAEDLETKIEQYLRFGAKQVWVLYPKARRIHVLYPAGQRIVLDELQTLEGGDVLPGFSVKVADLFV